MKNHILAAIALKILLETHVPRDMKSFIWAKNIILVAIVKKNVLKKSLKKP